MASKGYNPFDEASFVIDNGEGFNDDDFLSDEAGADFLASNDADAFIFGNTTIGSIRMADETFQNQTIGQYLGQGSADIDSASFLEPVRDDIVLMCDSEAADRKGSHPAFSQKDTGDGDQNENSSTFSDDEPVFLFSRADFLNMDESIPHSPPSFLQAIDDSRTLGVETSPPNDEPMKDVFDSGLDSSSQADLPSLPNDNTHHPILDQKASMTKDQTVASAFESMGFIESEMNYDNCNTNNSHSFPATSIEELRHSSSQPVQYASASSSSCKPQADTTGEFASPELNPCPPDISSMSTFLKGEEDAWDFTLTDINQMVEGINNMDLEDAFAQIMAKKKEKVKSQRAPSSNKQPEKRVSDFGSKEPTPVQSDTVFGTGRRQYSSSELNSPPSSLPSSMSAATRASTNAASVSTSSILDTSAAMAGSADPDFALNSSIRQQLRESIRPGHNYGRGGDAGNSSMVGGDDSIAGVSLCCDNNITLPNNLTVADFAASTPMYNHHPNVRDLGSLRQSAIHRIVSPNRVQKILDVPTHVDMPEVCCVLLSQQVQFTVRNKLKSGVQCTFSIIKLAYNGKVVDGCVCPFDFNRRITLCPSSQETMQVLFNPTCAGHFCASMEVTAQNLTNSEEMRVYEIVLTGRAEFPKFKVLPNSEEIDFGDLIWGNSDHKTIKVQNVGQATVPVRFTVVRTNSPLCSFSFQSTEATNPDTSKSLLTRGPHNPIHSVISMSLPGVREGEQAVTHSINVYCHIKAVDTAHRKYNEACEVFEGVLTMEMDSPIPRQRHLTQFRLRVRTGMVKLHLDRSSLILSSLPGQTKEGTVKVVNSGNISMKVALDLEPSTDVFHVAPRHMLVDPNAYQLARVTFSPQEHKDVEVRLVLSDRVCINFLPVKGQTRHHILAKITASASSMSFGGVPTGDKVTKTFKFSLDQDVQVKCFIRQGITSPFQVATDEGVVKDFIEIAMTKGVRSTVNVVFIPEEVKCVSSTLVLQVVLGDSFSDQRVKAQVVAGLDKSIPLTGYGGVSSIQFTGVKETSSGETVIPVSAVDSVGSPFTHCLTVTNTGVRCAFIKAVFHDMSSNVMNPHQATVMPSELLLAPQESQEMVLWMQHQPDTAKSSGMSLKGIVKFTYGDEINRQLLHRNPSSECQRQTLNYILELTQDQKTVLNAEMQHLPRDISISLNAFKSSVKSKKIGLLAGVYAAELGQPRTEVRPTSNPSLGPRPVLQTVNFNKQQQLPSKGDKDCWTLSPVSISFKVLDARSKEFAQIINYTDKELRFSVEADAYLSVTPTKGMVATKSWCQLEVTTSGKFWAATHKALCALIKVRCNEETKHIRVLIEGDATVIKMIFPPVFTKDTVTAESSRHPARSTQSPSTGDETNPSAALQAVKSQRLASSCHQQRSVRDDMKEGIRGPEMVIIPPVCLGNRTEFTYVFTNISQEAITWKALPMVPLSCEPGSLHPTSPMQSSVFSPHPPSGILEAGGVQTVSLGFAPITAGSYRQVWGIEYNSATFVNMHSFTIYAKANPRESQSGTQEAPTSLSPKRQQHHQQALSQPQHQQHHQQALSQPQHQQHHQQALSQLSQPQHQEQAKPQTAQAADNLPKWTSCQPQPKHSRQSTTSVSPRSLTGITASASSNDATTTTSASVTQNTKQPDASGDHHTDRVRPSETSRCLQLVEKVLRFSTLGKGHSETLYLKLKNTSSQDADMTVEQQPGAPFIIRHTNFTLRKDRMTKVPVVFKPLHVSKFQEQVVMRDKRTNITFTAILEAQCVP